MVTGVAPPKYLQLQQQVRSRITSGEYPLNRELPSIADLAAEFEMSKSSARRALDQLKADGILEGQQGKAIIVKSMPADADNDRATVETLSREVAGLREMLTERGGVDEALAAVERIESNLMDLYGKLGFDYPHRSSSSEPNEAARPRKRARG